MDFKLACKDDVDVLVAFRKQQLIDEGQVASLNIDNELQRYFLSLFADERSVIWKAEENGQIITVGGVYFFQYPPSFENQTGQTAYVHSMYTAKEYRGQGAASRILSFMIDEAKKRDCKVIQLQASKQGKPVYEKIGFVEADGHMSLRL